MSEWWTYRLSDFLMFTPKTYYRLFELYNSAIWPAQILALTLGLTLVWLTWRGGAGPGRVAAAILAVAWLWVAWAFHWRRYAGINLAATWFAVGFAIQALLLAVAALRPTWLSSPPPKPDRVGVGVAAFAVAALPFIGPLFGRSWRAVELFGLAPDPTAVATLGFLLAATAPRVVMIIPGLWCVVSWATLWAMGAVDAWVGLGAMVVVVARAAVRRSPLAVDH